MSWRGFLDAQRVRAELAARRAELAERNNRETPHYLYRCWDSEGLLLYIGCSNSPEQRIAGHLKNSPPSATSEQLALQGARWAIDPEAYRGRDAGRAAEKAAIETESPLLNIHHNKRSGTPTRHLAGKDAA